MWIFRFNAALQYIFRLINIFHVIATNYLAHWLYRRRFLRRIFDPKGKKLTSRSERLRMVLEDLGPTFIKFGQIVADRPDLVTDRLRVELKKLQSSVKPFDNYLAYDIIERELGDTIAEIFEKLDEHPIASASIAQVYRGVLRNGAEVAVKVQRPNIRHKIYVDLALMKIFAAQIAKSYPELANFNLAGFVEDFGKILKKELDFTNEASNMLRFSEMFKNDDYCHIPAVYAEYSTQKILVMEFVHGIPPDQTYDIIKAGLDPQQIAENGMHIILKMILKYGFFHADPHPGNILIRGNNQVVLLDHGMVASLKPGQIQALINFMLGFSNQDSHSITRALLQLMEVRYFKEQVNLEFEINELIQKYSYIPYEKVDISIFLTETFEVIMRHGLKIPSNLYMLLKSLGTIQKFAESLHADLPLVNMIKPYAQDKIREKFSLDSIINRFVQSAQDYIYLIDHLPGDVNEIINNLRKGVIKHELNIREDSYTNLALRQNINRLAFVFILGLMLLCSTILRIFLPEHHLITVFFYVSVIGVSWTALRLLVRTRFD